MTMLTEAQMAGMLGVKVPSEKVYYAHSMHLYGSKQEERDIETLIKMGYEVINPSDSEFQTMFETWMKINNIQDGNKMEFFKTLIDECTAVAFRAHPNGDIPSGVGYEVKYGIEKGLTIFELPTLLSSRFLSVDDTREYLKLLGQR